MQNKKLSVTTSALISVGIRWTDRLIGLVSTLILARLLTPADLGVVAMASLVIGLIDVMLDLGVNITLIQNRDAEPRHYNAAWTLRIIQSCLATVVVYAAAQPAADYFQEPRVVEVMRVLSISLLFAGCENIGIVCYQKHLQYGLEFRFFFIKRIIGFAVTIVAAWLLRDFWALIIGALTTRFAGMTLSYVVHPMRPRLTLSGVREIVSVSTWILLRGIGNYFYTEAHRIFVGHRESSFVMGAYSLGGEIAALPSTELLAPLSRVLFPAFVQVKDDVASLKRAYLLALGIQALIGIPAGVGLALVANELVLAMLGEKWMAAAPFIQIIGAFNIINAISASGGYLLLTLNKVKLLAVLVWGQVIIFMALVEFAIPEGNAMAIAEMRLVVGTFGFIINEAFISYNIPAIGLLNRFVCIWRPLVASGLMVVALYETPMPTGLNIMSLLLLKILFGAFVYVVGVLGVWLLFLRPDGAEGYLLGKIADFLKGRAFSS